MTLLDIEDELAVARNFVECAFLACNGLSQSAGISAVLDAASDKIDGLIEAIRVLNEQLP